MDRDCIHWCEDECDDSCPMCWRGVIAPRFDDTEYLHWDAQWQQEFCHCGEKYYGVPSEEVSSSKNGSCQLDAQATDVAWNNRCIGWGPRPPDSEADCRTEAGEAVWEVRLEQLGILATTAGRFCSFTPCWVPQHFLLRTLWAWLHSFDWTCD